MREKEKKTTKPEREGERGEGGVKETEVKDKNERKSFFDGDRNRNNVC